ncbi:YraN family protein [Rhodobacter sp.]
MPFDFAPETDLAPETRFATARQRRGKRNYLTGIAAEEAVCRRYQSAGYDLVACRKRCPEGEIDILMRRGVQLVAIEVKSSVTHDLALEHASPDQLNRVSMACERCMQDMAGDGVSDMRLDLALVDGQGRIEVMESFLYF